MKETAKHINNANQHRTVGNHTESHFFGGTNAQTPRPFFGNTPVQPKLQVGAKDDDFEKQADAVADRVVHTPAVQHKAGEPEEINKKEIKPIDPVDNERQQKAATEEDERPAPQPEAGGIIHRKPDGSRGGTVPPAVAQGLVRSRGGGKPLDAQTKGKMESAMGADFGNVRIHNDSRAQQMSHDLGAQAFTHGNDIYFNTGKYDPSSSSGSHLLAHELTHTLQQGASVQTKRIQRAEDGTGPVASQPYSLNNLPDELTEETATGGGDGGSASIANNKLKIVLSNFPLKNYGEEVPDREFVKPTGERNTRQGSKWRSGVRDKVRAGLTSILPDEETVNSSDEFVLKIKGNGSDTSTHQIVGNVTRLTNDVLVPFWKKADGSPQLYDIEHKIDWQIAGGGGTPSFDIDHIDNLVLLDREKNRSLGHDIKTSIATHTQRVINRYAELKGWLTAEHAFNHGDNVQVVFRNPKPAGENISDSHETIRARDFDNHTVINANRVDIKKFDPENDLGEDDIVLKTSRSGVGSVVPYNLGSGANEGAAAGLRHYLTLTGRKETAGGSGKQTNVLERVTVTKIVNQDENAPVLAQPAEGIVLQPEPPIKERDNYYRTQSAGYSGMVRDALRVRHLSPIEISEADFHPMNGWNATGRVVSDLSILENIDISFELINSDYLIQAVLPLDRMASKFPAPFEATACNITLSAATETGLQLAGNLDFKLGSLGSGTVSAGFNTQDGVFLEGSFDFNSERFNPASVSIDYRNNEWTIGGSIGIGAGQIAGVDSGQLSVEYTNQLLSIAGYAALSIPGLDRVDLAAQIGEHGNFEVNTAVQLAEIPGIRSGAVDVRLTSENGNITFGASGTAQPNIPGIDTTLLITYNDGALLIAGDVAYNRGLLSGTISVGITNQGVGEDGQPAGPPTAAFTVFGGGQLTLRITPWLAATAGVRFLPNGELEIMGRIGLPSTVDIFPRKEIERNLFRMPTIEIPLFAIPLGPRSLGVVAQINGGLDFNAGIGPGQLQELFGEVRYNPSHPEQTALTGGGRFVIPADAGLKLRGDLSLGLSVGIASLTGGIELTGALGLDGQAMAAVDLNWTPETGLALNAVGEVRVRPRFKFDVNLLARATLDLWITRISEEWRHNLAAYEWGPGLDFGLRFPINYREGEPFDLSFDDIEVIQPDIDIMQTISGLANDVKEQVF